MDQPLSACELLEGKTLPGQKKLGQWHIGAKLRRDSVHLTTGGTFSVGYEARHDDGTLGFVKATDIGFLSSKTGQAFPQIAEVIKEQEFERAILDVCRGNNMDRIVAALDYGEFVSVDSNVRDIVFFIVFERARGDVRAQCLVGGRQPFSWIFQALHNLCVAVQQLHAALIAHNDVKPSNLLVFEEFLQKLADVGRATSDSRIGPWDTLVYAGDWNYAAPEFWYKENFPRIAGRIHFDVRRMSDLYLIGSMAYFFVTGVPLTPVMRKYLRPEHWPQNWTDTYAGVLPFVQDAFEKSMADFNHALNQPQVIQAAEAEEFRVAVRQLCEPNPESRGVFHDANNKYSLNKYVSLFDRLARRTKVFERRV